MNSSNKAPTEAELQSMRQKAEAGNPLYMYEYGKAMLSRDPSVAIPFLEQAMSRGIGDAGMELAVFYDRNDQRDMAIGCMLDASEYDPTILDQAVKGVMKFGNDAFLTRYLDLCARAFGGTDAGRAKLVLYRALAYDTVKRSPERFPEHAKTNKELGDAVFGEINSLLDEGLWSDPDLYKLLDAASDLTDESVRRKLWTRMEYLRDHNGQEPPDLDVLAEVSECMLYVSGNSEFADRLERLVLEGRLDADGPEIVQCEKCRLGWISAVTGQKLPMPVVEVSPDWDSGSDLTEAGRRYLQIGGHHVVARVLLHRAALGGSAEAMFLLGYMVDKRLGEYEWRESVSGFEYIYERYNVLRPGSELSGVEWMERAARGGYPEARSHIERMAGNGDLEARFALQRLSR